MTCKTLRPVLFFLVALTFAVPAEAGTILYFNDFVVGTDRMGQALANRVTAGDSVTIVASSSAFQTELATGNYDLGIFMVQNSFASSYASAINALGAFVAGGGRSIYADWSRNSSLVGQFEASFDSSTNQTQMTVTAAPFLVGLGTGDVSLFNPGWGVFSTGLGLSGGTAATFANGSGAISIGNDGRSIVNGFLTDTFVNGLQGAQLYENQIAFLLDGSSIAPVPEPSSLVILGLSGFVIVCGVRRRRLLK